MVKELLYRRSFHSDRDLKGLPSMVELENAVAAKKANADTALPGGGFEAPRNSLDVSIGGFSDMRRHSEVRWEDIPIGYELSRSLTAARRQNKDFLIKKSASSADLLVLPKPKFVDKGSSETDQKPRTSSVLARLMGLDPLPHQEDVQSSSYPSSRRLVPHEVFMSGSMLGRGSCTDKQGSVSSQKGTHIGDRNIERTGFVDLPLRNHPQEKQLQEFKREFTAHLSQQVNQSLPISSNIDMLCLKKKQSFGVEPLQESREFLDALDFLHTNKEFFAKVLNDPSSFFAKHVQRHKGLNKDGSREKGGQLTRSFSDSRKDSFTSPPFAHDLTEAKRKQELSQVDSDAKVRSIFASKFGQDEQMPARPRQHTKLVSSPVRTGYDQPISTKIVVLKPKLGKHASDKPPIQLSQLDASFKARVDSKESGKYDIKDRLQGAAKYLPDAQDSARQIIKQVREDMSRRLPDEKSHTLEAGSRGRGRRLPTRRVSIHGDTHGASDGEGYSSTSRRVQRENLKANVSLPSSPRLARSDADNEVGFNGREDLHEDRNSRRAALPTKNPKGIELKLANGTRSGEITGIKKVAGSPKVLPRSLPAPVSATVQNTAIERVRKSRFIVEGATSGNARPAGNSLFKERLLNLQDNFSSSKKISTRKQSLLQCSSPSDSSELSSPRQFASEHETSLSVGSMEQCNVLSGYQWQETSSMQDDQDKLAILHDAISSNHLTPSRIHQWASTVDLLDSASDISLEKCEQPSPVSVLEMPFQEDSPSSVDTTGTVSKCPETTVRIAPLDLDYEKRLLDLHGAALPNTRHSLLDSSADETVFGSEPYLESLSMCDIAGSEEDLAYIGDLLAFAGFSVNKVITACTFSEDHGLDPSVFERLESYYSKRSKRKTGNDSSLPLDTSKRKLMFDVVDEILARKLSESTVLCPFKPSGHVVYTGSKLLELIWAHLSDNRFLHCESEEESLDAVASKDLMKKNGWVDSQNEMQAVVVELEGLIFSDLIREVVHECIEKKAES